MRFTLLLTLAAALTARSASAVLYNITAMAPVNNASVLQCWQLSTPVTSAQDSGLTLGEVSLGATGNTTILVTPGSSKVSPAWALAPQYVFIVSGVTQLVDSTNTTATFYGGSSFPGAIVTDTEALSTKGHTEEFVSADPVVVITVPLNGNAPNHTVLYNGPCNGTEMNVQLLA